MNMSRREFMQMLAVASAADEGTVADTGELGHHRWGKLAFHPANIPRAQRFASHQGCVYPPDQARLNTCEHGRRRLSEMVRKRS